MYVADRQNAENFEIFKGKSLHALYSISGTFGVKLSIDAQNYEGI